MIRFIIDSSLTGSKLHQGSMWYIDYLFFGPISDVDDYLVDIPNAYYLYQNFLNPFNPHTKIKYQILEICWVILKVYDLIGNEITTLVNEENLAGSYEIEFTDHFGENVNLTSGIYFYQLKAGEFMITKKMTLLK